MKNKIMENKKGQMLIVNIILYVIVLIVAAVLTPVISQAIVESINNSMNLSSTSIMVMNMIVPIFWLGIIVIFFIAVVPRPMRDQ